MAKREKVEHTEELRWDQLKLLLEWPEQITYEWMRPPVVFGDSVAERARQIGVPETTLRRKIASFKSEGMWSLFETEQDDSHGGHSTLPPEVRGFILNLKAEHPPIRDNEIATICYVRFGQRRGQADIRVIECHFL